VPLKDLQRRLVEVGRIRMGTSDEIERRGKKFRQPKRLETWRLTSRNREMLETAAAVYGGTVEPWGDEWELVTTSDQLEIMLLPGQALSQWWELWGQRGQSAPVECLRRCDGEREVLTDGPCLCSPDYEERRELALKGQACKPTTRLSVLLPAVQGIGCWRLETHGYYAAVELAGSADLLEQATAQGVMLPASLRLEYRRRVSGGQTKKFPVPVIDLKVPPDEVLKIAGGSASREPTPSLPPAPRGRQPQAEIGPAEEVVYEDAIPVPEDAEPEELALIEEKDRRRLFATARELGIDNEKLKAIVYHACGASSTKEIPAAKVEEVFKLLKEQA